MILIAIDNDDDADDNRVCGGCSCRFREYQLVKIKCKIAQLFVFHVCFRILTLFENYSNKHLNMMTSSVQSVVSSEEENQLHYRPASTMIMLKKANAITKK